MERSGRIDKLTPALQLELLARLLVSVVLGGVLGWERQLGQHPAGLRTHILVTLGACAFTIAGTYGVAGEGTVQDAGRVAAQIVAGVGFLGAGTIWRSGSDRVIYGLTTAASIWVSASIGMLSGFGLYVLASGCALLGFTVLRLLRGVEDVPQRLASFRLSRLRSSRTGAGAAAQATLTETTAERPEPGSHTDVAGMMPAHDPVEGDRTALRADASERRPRTQRKKRKRKRQDAEMDSMAEISDAPPSSR